MRGRLIAALVLLLSLVLGANAFAQTTNATVGGTVSDASGALIPGVTITATNTGTGIVSTTVSNETGAYQFGALQSGTYRVSAELPGFQTLVREAALGIGQQVRLNFSLELGNVTTAVDVSVATDTLIATTSASVGTVLPEYKVRDLPLANRNVLDLVGTTAGVVDSSIAGAPQGFSNTTRDGISVQDARYASGIYSQTYTSPDLVDEVRVIVAPADAETGRGSGQVQMSTRSGTNRFSGALFWTNRNPIWDAATFSDNFNNIEKSYLNRNQFGGRLGGPIVKNKTFFFFLYEAMRSQQRENFLATNILTDTARQGIYRYFPGVQSANANANTPTVDRAGSPVKPAAATGDLQSFNVFTRDPLRPGPDPTGAIQSILARMPRVNDFQTGDGLNVAGHRFVRRYSGSDGEAGLGESVNRDQINLRIDHNFNSNHKLSFVISREHTWSDASLVAWPNGIHAQVIRNPKVHTASFVSTLSPRVVNEFRWGWKQGQLEYPPAHQREGEAGLEGKKFLFHTPGGYDYTITPGLFTNGSAAQGMYYGNRTPLWIYGDTLSWTAGKHAFKGGVEVRFGSQNGFSSSTVIPQVTIGEGGLPVTGITNQTISGLSSTDATRAVQLLTSLSGSVSTIAQAFSINDPKDLIYREYQQEYKKYRDIHQNEFSAFYKDDWKVRESLTLNLGVRYDWYGTPWESKGLALAPIDGSDGLFGISGRSFADWMRPGHRAGLTVPQFVGKSSTNPDKMVYPDDWNNFSPAVGMSWSLPWWGRDKTVLRLGYGWGYQGRLAGGGGLTLYTGIAAAPGGTFFSNHTTTRASEMYLNNIVLPIAERPPDGRIAVSPVDGARNLTESNPAFDNNMTTPYIQNFSFEIQRELKRNLTLEVRYVGTKGTKLFNTINLNVRNVIGNGILEAFQETVAGGNAALFNQMLMGLNVTGVGTVNGTTITGSQALRSFAGSRNFLANGDPVGLANFLTNTTNFTGEVGGIFRRAGLPENFVLTNPQYNNATLQTSGANSTYHSLNVAVTKRLSRGFTNQTTYTWSRTIGTTLVDPRERGTKTLANNHRTHDIRSNGTFELPIGPGRLLLGNAPGFVQRLVERWQLGAIFSMNSGSPLTFTAGPNHYGGGNNFPDMVVRLLKSFGQVKILDQPGAITYFEGLQQVTDPGIAGVTTLQNLQGANTNRAIADAQGNLLLVRPPTGRLGNMGQSWIEGPGRINLDANIIKRIRIGEGKQFELRVDAVNVLNRPNFGNPNMDINSVNFGRISLPTDGNREFTFNLRLDF